MGMMDLRQISGSMKWQLLHNACWVGDARQVARLLEAGASPNQIAPTDWRQTPLGRTLEFRITAPRHAGHVETVRILLQRGADPAVRSTYLDMTPYELATFCGLEPAAELLRAFRTATPHPTGMTDLWLLSASRLSEPAALEGLRLLKNEHDVNLSWRKSTPLMMATGHAAHFRLADELLKAGADPNAGTSILHASCEVALQTPCCVAALPCASGMERKFVRFHRANGAAQGGVSGLRSSRSGSPGQ